MFTALRNAGIVAPRYRSSAPWVKVGTRRRCGYIATTPVVRLGAVVCRDIDGVLRMPVIESPQDDWRHPRPRGANATDLKVGDEGFTRSYHICCSMHHVSFGSCSYVINFFVDHK
jgi:hypothetical protein